MRVRNLHPSNGTYALGPADYATIYNINPLYQEGINGSGTTIAVVARTDIKTSDVTQFRSVFGLASNDPQTVVNGTDPGDLGGDEESEAVLDTSWAGATAPGATVKLVVSKSTNDSDGTDLSELYIVDNNVGDVMTESFGSCEADYGSSGQSAASFYSSLAQQAAAEGITYLVAAGDSGAEGCDDPSSSSASGPISVNILATPYTIAVGGTQFNENGNYSQYWNSRNDSALSSALGYIPEDVWNESCTRATGVNPCTNGNTPGLWAGGGGASTLFSKPSWQSGVAGIPNDGARDVPDVSLTAAGHDAYLLCIDGSCTPNSRGRISFSGYGGTSAATPSFAGIMALVVQKTGARLGQADSVLYSLAASENPSSCNGSAGSPAGNCIFNDVTAGNNAVPGESGYNTSTGEYQATAGYDLATGLGSVNVTNLVNGWNGMPSSSSPFHIAIGQPSSANSTFIGLAQFSGSATRDNATITGIAIAIDGVPYGTATWDGTNWSIIVDTTLFSDGSHTLDVTATSSAGDHGTATAFFTIANWSSADPMTVDIDVPASNSQPFSGTVGFGGWAIDSTGAISNVSISIDGVSYGLATYGVSRADVCAVYPGRAGCPNVGWNFMLDTTALADGVHTLEVTGVTGTGQNTTVTGQFTTSGNPIAMSIDQPRPGDNGPFSGPVNFGGWAIDNNTSIASVAVSIDGVFLRNATYGAPRTDVCTVFPGRAGCPNVGWNVVVDTTTLANGNHTLDVTATASTGAHETSNASFSVANSSGGPPIKMFIDQPGAQNAVVVGLTTVSGWAIDDNGPIASVTILVDGASMGTATYGNSRPDVCAAYPGRTCNSGWTFSLDTTLIPDGSHTLQVAGVSTGGDRLTLSTRFTVANWTSNNPMKLDIDIPGTQSGPFSGTVNFGGWAISDIAAISNVAIAIDGVPYGNASYGVSRSDVCAAYPGRAGCPNVGWNFALDTTGLANGKHTLQITGTSSGGQSSTATGTFTVSNSGGPVMVDIDVPGTGGIITGQASMGGWAVDTSGNGSIRAVQILVDGVLISNATYGVSRADVCLVYTQASGCPNVGWEGALDTTLLANGAHTLQVRAISTTGQQATASRVFTVYQY